MNKKSKDLPNHEQMDFADANDEFAVHNLADGPTDSEDDVGDPNPNWVEADSESSNGESNPPDNFIVENPWHETDRAAPSEFLRSALFSPNRRANQLMIGERIATNKSTELTIWGDSRTQFDLDIWMACVHLARFGLPVRATIPQLLKVAGRSPGGTADVRVRESLELLGCFQVKLTVKPKIRTFGKSEPKPAYTFSGHLIEHLSWERAAGRWDYANLALHPNLAELFRPQRRTHIPARVRSQLGDRPLAQWMYAFLRSHRTVFPLPVSYYQNLSGADSSVADFRSRLQKALTLIAEAGLIYSASLRKDLLFVQRNKPVVETAYPEDEWSVRSPLAKRTQTTKGEKQ